MSEFLWIAEILEEVVYPPFADRLDMTEEFAIDPNDLSTVKLQEAQVSYLLEVIRARHREALLGEEPAVALSACGGMEAYIDKYAPLEG